MISPSGMRLPDPYVLATTDFRSGPPDFENAGTDLMLVPDDRGARS